MVVYCGPVYASKLAASHKGPLLVREKDYMLKEFGYGPEHLAELIYLVGQISGNNMLMVHMISEGMPVDEMLQPFSPFKKTTYGLRVRLFPSPHTGSYRTTPEASKRCAVE